MSDLAGPGLPHPPQVCATNQKACIVIRSLSDLAGGDAAGNQIGNFFGMASYHSSIVLQALVGAV